MKKTRIILLLFSAMQLAGINNISANTESGLHLTTSNLKCQVPFGRPDEAYDLRCPEVDFFHNPFPSSICGIPGNAIEDVLIENVDISYPGRATKGMAYMPCGD